MKKTEIIESLKEWAARTNVGCYEFKYCPHLNDGVHCESCRAETIARFLNELLPDDMEGNKEDVPQ